MLCGCTPAPVKNYAIISGLIKNNQDSVLRISGFDVQKNIKINKDGSFRDSLKITNPNRYKMYLNNKRGYLFLKNGYDLNLEGDAASFFLGFSYTGIGSETNNLLVAHFNYSKTIGQVRDYLDLNEVDFVAKLEKAKKELDSINALYKNVDTIFLNTTTRQTTNFFSVMEEMYEEKYSIEFK